LLTGESGEALVANQNRLIGGKGRDCQSKLKEIDLLSGSFINVWRCTTLVVSAPFLPNEHQLEVRLIDHSMNWLQPPRISTEVYCRNRAYMRDTRDVSVRKSDERGGRFLGVSGPLNNSMWGYLKDMLLIHC
jgi:hypothetical protein